MGHPIGGFEVSLERGPDWLFVRLVPSADGRARHAIDLGASLREIARDHGTSRVVVELDALDSVDEDLLEGLAMLGRILERESGVLRVCGVKAGNGPGHASCGSLGHLPHFSCRHEAVRAGSWECACPPRPR